MGKRWCEACGTEEGRHTVAEVVEPLDLYVAEEEEPVGEVPGVEVPVLLCDDCAPRDDRGRVTLRV